MRQSDSSLSSFNLGDVTSQTSALRGEDSNAIDELLAAYKMSLDTNCCDDVIEGWSRDQADMADLVSEMSASFHACRFNRIFDVRNHSTFVG